MKEAPKHLKGGSTHRLANLFYILQRLDNNSRKYTPNNKIVDEVRKN